MMVAVLLWLFVVLGCRVSWRTYLGEDDRKPNQNGCIVGSCAIPPALNPQYPVHTYVSVSCHYPSVSRQDCKLS